jgi:hypothetical protein
MAWCSAKAQGQIYLYIYLPIVIEIINTQLYMEPENALPCSREPATDPYSDSDVSSPHLPILLP